MNEKDIAKEWIWRNVTLNIGGDSTYLVPTCPTCGEVTYSEPRCPFCNQLLKDPE